MFESDDLCKHFLAGIISFDSSKQQHFPGLTVFSINRLSHNTENVEKEE